MSIEAMCCLRRLPPDSLFERAGHQSYVFRCSCDPRSMLCAATPIGASSSASHRSLVSVVATNRDTWSEATPSRSSGSSSGRWTDKLLYVVHAFRCRSSPVARRPSPVARCPLSASRFGSVIDPKQILLVVLGIQPVEQLSLRDLCTINLVRKPLPTLQARTIHVLGSAPLPGASNCPL